MTEDKFASLVVADKEYSDDSLELLTQWAEHNSDLFVKSEAGKALTSSQKDNVYFILTSLTELAYSYHLQKPNQWNNEMLIEVCTDIMPRKISTEPAFFNDIVPVLRPFLAWCEKEGILSKTGSMQKRLIKIKQQIEDNASNPENFGLAKSLLMGAVEHGVDMENIEDLHEFLNKQVAQTKP
ncbi:MAG: hypothetical protein O2970_11025 [Proteobacteria bacterium]|nr:hypothetical protein [Pseudomonadota bacterium]